MEESAFCPSCDMEHVSGYPYCVRVDRDVDSPLLKVRNRRPEQRTPFMKEYLIHFDVKTKGKDGKEGKREVFVASMKDKELAETIVKRYNYFITKQPENVHEPISNQNSD